jgi:transcriptional regulator with XRE-family HTH domain
VPKEADLNPTDSPAALFGFELRRYRKERGWSQQQLARAVQYSLGTISMIETARRSPTEEFARHCDEALKADGALMRLWPMVSHASAPSWFRPWLDIEAMAEAIRMWAPLIVPGILQTEDYARAILNGDIGVTPEHVEEQVKARIERQAILKRPTPPLLWIVIDESVLHRPIGNPEVMKAQLERLLQAGHTPRIGIQVLPLSAYCTAGVAGGFAIAQAHGTMETGYVESAGVLGRVTERQEDVKALIYRYDAIRSEALSKRESLNLIKETMQRWTS